MRNDVCVIHLALGDLAGLDGLRDGADLVDLHRQRVTNTGLENGEKVQAENLGTAEHANLDAMP